MDACLLRAAVFPDDAEVTPPPVGGDDDQWRAWIARVWQSEAIAEAVEHASPKLATRIERALLGGTAPEPGSDEVLDAASDQDAPSDGEQGDGREHGVADTGLARAGLALYRYVLRMRYRATPFGLFAGVAPAVIAGRVGVRWAGDHRARASVDAVWLAAVIDQLERSPQLRCRLTVLGDSTCVVRGERLVLPCRRPAVGEDGGPGQASVRHTAAVRAAMARASRPVTVTELAEAVAERYPTTPMDTIHTLLGRLIEQRFLISCLRAPMSVTDPLGHLVGQLDQVGADAVADIAPTVRAVRDLAAAVRDFPRTGPGRRRRARAATDAAVRPADIHEPCTPGHHAPAVARAVSIDLRADCDLVIPRQVADEMTRAGSVLARLSAFPAGSPAWESFRARFVQRYGTGVVVAMCDAIDPAVGIDLPAGYRGSAQPRPGPGFGERDEYLIALAQRAALDHAVEVVLTDHDLAALDVGQQAVGPAQVDLRARVEATTRQAVDRGEFTVVVTGVAPNAGATVGRFLPLLNPHEQARFAAAYAQTPGITPGAHRVQVSSPPLDVGTDTVARCPALFPLVSLGEHAPGALGVHDLSIVADQTRLWFIETRTGRPVEPVIPTAVDLSAFTHPWARLLGELPRSHTAGFGLFSWGAAARLPFLPRVRHGRAVLCPASWRLTQGDLIGTGAGAGEVDGWRAALAAWRQRWRVPALVQLGDGDQRLRLDLTQPADLHLLRRRLPASGAGAVLHEAPDRQADGWFDGRAHEITLTLARHDLPAPPTAAVIQRAVNQRAVVAAPGPVLRAADTGWAALTLVTAEASVPELLTGHLPRLWQRWEPEPVWWFTRPRSGRVRMHVRLTETVTLADVSERVTRWARQARRDRILGDLTWDTYRPETGRYGDGATLAAAEAVFVADSVAALAELAAGRAGHLPLPAVTAASLVESAAAFHGATDTAMAWLVEHVPRGGPPLARALRRHAVELTDPTGDDRAARIATRVPGTCGAALASAWVERRPRLRAYREGVAASVPDPDEVLQCLLDAHTVRVAGPGLDGARTALGLARAAALSWTARQAEPA